MAERTEGAGLSGSLTVTVDGEPVRLRALKIDAAEIWLEKMAAAVGKMDVLDTEGDGSDAIARMLKTGPAAQIELLAAYDVDDVLGGVAGIRSRMTPAELEDAFETVVSAADPKGPAFAHSVVEAFGLQSRWVRVGLQQVGEQLDEAMSGVFRKAISTNGYSPNGASTLTPSAAGSPPSNSSSSGATDRNARSVRRGSRRT